MKVDFNIIKDTSNKTKVIVFGIITVLVSLIGLTYSWVANWLVGTSNDISLTAASLYLNYRGTSPTILAYLAPGETVEKNFQITNYNDSTVTYNLTWESVQNLFNPTSEIIYTVSEKTLGEIVSARTAPSSDINVARNISIAPGETQYLTLTLTFVLDEERDQANNIGNYFVGDITIDQNTQTSLDYTEIYANDILVNSIPNTTTFKFDDKRSWCTDGTTISFNMANSTFSYTNLTSTTSCKTYFYTSKDFAYIAPTMSVPSPYTSYPAPYTGWYQIEAWGAEGGRNAVEAGYTYSQSVLGGKGGYTSGKVYLNANDIIYVYVGGKGPNGVSGQIVTGGYNGGGRGDYDHNDNEAAAAGGGATDIRLSPSTNTINSRIMVAGGGGGAAYNGVGGYGGGLIGGETTYSTGGTQIGGYSFAIAQPGTFVNTNVDVGGGGGGYYGGYANSSGTTSTYKTSGAGGSSYISGHTGCVAIASADLANNPRTPRTGTGGVSCETGTTENSCSIHYSNKYFKDTKMIDGSGYLWTYQKGIQEKMPNPNGGYYDLGVGHSGDGYARIKYVPNLATHTISFNLAGGIQAKDYDGEYYEGYNYYIENPTRYEYRFTGWTVNGIGTKINNNILTVGVANSALTANWVQAYTLTINAVGGTLDYEAPDYLDAEDELYIPIPTREGHDFLGWTISATDGSGTSTGSTINGTAFKMGTKSTTLTAAWMKSDYDFIAPTTETPNPYYTLIIPKTGWYEIEAWGAQGGSYNASYSGGKGGYTSGKLYLTKDNSLYIYVGGKGINVGGKGGYNGGGIGGNSGGYPGGGATDIRYFGEAQPDVSNLVWNNTLGLNSRIMVASGGGGVAYFESTGSGDNCIIGNSSGGGLIGKGGNGGNSCEYYGTGGSQVSSGHVFNDTTAGLGGFGYGGSGMSNYNKDSGGGAGGYYGGGSSNGWKSGGGGGSSFISGYAGVNAIDEGSISNPRAYLNKNTKHYSGKHFVDGVMLNGSQSMPSPSGSTETGHSENGYAKITYLGSSTPTRINTKLNNVRYIKDCINGSDLNGNNHWAEIQAIDTQGINRAQGKTGKLYNANGTQVIATYAGYDFTFATDGIVNDSYFQGLTYTGYQCFVVDISDEENNTYDLNEIGVWHYWPDGRTYYSNTTYVSNDGTNWTPVIATQEPESSQGKRVSAYDANTTVTPIYRVTNLVTNGSFTSTTTTGWSAVAGTITSNGLYINDTNTSSNYWNCYPYSFIEGHIYYEAIENKMISFSAGWFHNAIMNTAGNSEFFTKSTTTSNDYVLSSLRFTAPSTLTMLQIGSAFSSITTSYTKNVRMFDLTSIFGAGREPTKEWCDVNLSYFNGTQALLLNYY